MKLSLTILLIALSCCAFAQQDTSFETKGITFLDKHYTIVFKYVNNPDSVRTRTRKARVPKTTDKTGKVVKDTVIDETYKVYFYRAKAMLYQKFSDGVYHEITDWINAPFVLNADDIFLNKVYTALVKRATRLGLIKNELGAYTPPPSVEYEQVAGHTSHYKYATQRGDKSLWMTSGENFMSPGDTLVVRSSLNNWSYAYISNFYTYDVPIVVEGAQAVFTSGVSIENSDHIQFLGIGADSAYGFRITGGGTNMTITGKGDYIEVGYVHMQGGGVGTLWDKVEVSDVQNKYACDMSYLTDTAEHHHLHHILIKNPSGTIAGDAVYFRSTGGAGDRPMTCGGVTTYPIPPGAKNAELDNFIIEGVDRQAIQMSLTYGTGNSMHDIYIRYTGRETGNDYQGAGGALGAKCDSVEVYNLDISGTKLYNFYSYAKRPYVHDNHFDSAGRVKLANGTWYINPQGIPSALASSTQSNTRFRFENNWMGLNSATNAPGSHHGTQLVFYGSIFNVSADGNIACNSGYHATNEGVDNKTGVAFSYTCAVDPEPDPEPEPPTVIKKIIRRLTHFKFGLNNRVNDNAPADTAINYGIFILQSETYPDWTSQVNRAVELGVKVIRLNYVYGASDYVSKIEAAKVAGLKVQLTYNENALNLNNGYATDSNTFKNHFRETLLSSDSLPDFICVRNEPGNEKYWDTTHPDRYINNELKPAATIADSLGIPVSDGGILPNLVFNLYKYYQDNNLTDSLAALQAVTGISGINSTIAKNAIAWNNTVLAGIATIDKLTHVNLHGAEPIRDSSLQTTSTLAPKLFSYAGSVSGKTVWCNEFHTRNHSPELLYELLDELKTVCKNLIVYFSGDTYSTSGDSIDLSEYYKNYLQQ